MLPAFWAHAQVSLKAECPTDWEPARIELEGNFSGINARWEYVLSNISPRD